MFLLFRSVASQAELSVCPHFICQPNPDFLERPKHLYSFSTILFRFAYLRNISFARPNGQEEDRRAA
jgi:hypothetical protein